MITNLSARNAGLDELVRILRDQHARKLDVIAPARALAYHDGILTMTGSQPVLTPDGVTAADGRYRPTELFDAGIADKLGIPLAYVRRLRTQNTALLDANVNAWLSRDDRSFLVRTFQSDTAEGIARAMLSSSYRIIDNLDALVAALDGVRRAGVDVVIDGADLTEKRLQLRLVCPQVTALAPVLTAGYRSPFRDPRIRRAGGDGSTALAAHGLGDPYADSPVVYAGLVISNSETGGGAFSITPRIVVQVCKNGMTVTRDAMREVHLGGRQADGMIRWSDQTQDKALALVTAKTTDAVRSFLDGTYLARAVEDIERRAGVDLAGPQMDQRVREVAKRLTFDEATTTGVIDHFTRGAQLTSGGLVNAITSYAQTVADADLAERLEASSLRALDLITA